MDVRDIISYHDKNIAKISISGKVLGAMLC